MSPEPDGGLNALATAEEMLGALPAAAMVVDHDVVVRYANKAALELGGGPDLSTGRVRSGDMLSCVAGLIVPGGCGHGDGCSSCGLRGAVAEVASGGKVFRKLITIQRKQMLLPVKTYYKLSASALGSGGSLVLLVLEDITELVSLQKLLPVCAWCRKVRDDDNYWHDIEAFLGREHGMLLTHGICADCAKKVEQQDED